MRPCKQLAIVCVMAWTLPTAFEARAAEPAVGVLTLHGVGSHRSGALSFDRHLRQQLDAISGGKVKVVVRAAYYHGESLQRQAQLWKKFDRLEDREPGALDQKIIRRLMLLGVGDAVAYANNPHQENSFYRLAHETVRSAIDKLHSELGDHAPIAVVAHSLGCKVVFDYICDAQTGSGIWKGGKRPSDFQKLTNLRLFVTTGCNLPFFESVSRPGQRRFFQVRKDFQWLNYYDRDDLLGWPLRPLGGRFEELVQDHERNKIGSTLTSHVKYWRDEALNQEIARRILALPEAAAAAAAALPESK